MVRQDDLKGFAEIKIIVHEENLGFDRHIASFCS
jgi:hypothetical protein